MVDVSDKYMKLATAATRQVETQAVIYRYDSTKKIYTKVRTYDGYNGIVSWNISIGQTSGAFQIGQAFCATLEMQLLRSCQMASNAVIDIEVRFIDPADVETASEWLPLGRFYVDSIVIDKQFKKIVAADKMLQLDKSYRSPKQFPQKTEQMLAEIASRNGFNITEQYTPLNDVSVAVYPSKGQAENGLKILFSRREILGFIASVNAGNVFFNRYGDLVITSYYKNDKTVTIDNCYTLTESGYNYDIADVVWQETGAQGVADTDDSYKQIIFQNPLDIPENEKSLALGAIKRRLVGLNVRQISLEKQGTGVYDIGDMVSVDDGTEVFTVCISGIAYSMSNGGFRETLYSVAASESESNYDVVQSSSQIGNEATAILYQQNEAVTELSDEKKELMRLQFSSTSAATAAAAVTINPDISKAGEMTAGIYVDQQEYQSFTEDVEQGKVIISVTYPLINLPSGGHTLSVLVNGTASGKIDIHKAFLTLFANGILSEAGFDGTLQFREQVPAIMLAENDRIIISQFDDKAKVKAWTPDERTLVESVAAILMQDGIIEISAFVDIPGGNDVALIDKENRLMYTRDSKRIHVKQFKFKKGAE